MKGLFNINSFLMGGCSDGAAVVVMVVFLSAKTAYDGLPWLLLNDGEVDANPLLHGERIRGVINIVSF